GEPLEVAVGLGLYCAERNPGAFHNAFITFNQQPQLVAVQGSLEERVRQAKRAPWGYSTNLGAVCQLMLTQAVLHQVPPHEMPSVLLIISDMQFNACVARPADTALAMMANTYGEAGYAMPAIVFWNVRASTGVPAVGNEAGVAL